MAPHPWLDLHAVPTPKEYVAKDGRKSYRVRIRDARGQQTTETFHTKSAAQQFCKLVDAIGAPAAIADRNRRDHVHANYVPTLAEWLPQHIDMLTGVTDRTRLDYAAMANRTFLPILGDLPLDAIDRAAVAKTINALDAKGLSAKSIANAHGLLSAVMASAVLHEHIGTNPCHKMRLPRSRETERRDERFLTHREYERLLAAIDPRHRILLQTLFGSGLRWGEITALNVGDVRPPVPPSPSNPEGVPAFLRVTKAWKSTPGRSREIGPPKSAKSRRNVTIGVPTFLALAPLLDRPAGELLFTAPRGGPIYAGWWRHRVWLPACEKAGLSSPRPDKATDPRGWAAWKFDGPRIHDARHSYASWLIEQGVPLELVQDQLGHESILTTRAVYGNLQPAMRNTVAEAASRALAPTPAIEA